MNQLSLRAAILVSLKANVRRVLVICIGFLFLPSATQAASVKKTQEVIVNQIKTDKSLQKKFEKWEGEKAVLLAEIRDLKIRSLWLDYQQEKYENYLSQQRQIIAELKQRKAEANRIRVELEPRLDQLVIMLEDKIAEDSPFLVKERKERIAFLKESLADYHIDLSEKLRRILEALRIEAEYGKTVEKTEEVLQLDGVPTKVTLIRIGRVALFYRSIEGDKIGRWNRNSESWEPLPLSYSPVLAKTAEMAAGKRAVELLDFPIGNLKELSAGKQTAADTASN